MNIEIVVVGKPKAGFASQGVEHYLKHLSGLATVKVVSIKQEPGGKNIPPEKVCQEEAARILKRIDKPGRTVALDVTGEKTSSQSLVKRLTGWERSGLNRLSFVIGGPWGLDKAVLDKADLVLSLSKMTFSHELSLLMILEQLYRAFSIKAGRPYAK